MNGALVVLQKEMREILGERYSRRGGIVQAVVVVAVMGILYPYSAPQLWITAHPLAVAYFGFFPGVLAVTVAADAFAGERERKTLETLLATPVGEWAVLFGKAAAAVVFSLTVTAIAFVCAVATVNVSGRGPAFFLPDPILAIGALGAALPSAALMTSLAIVTSMRIPVARSAQQMTALLSFVVFGAIAATWAGLRLPIAWPNVFAAEALLAALAVVAFAAARALFRRDRFFERR
jgi:ABC-2 type transport system permease protein